MPMRRVLVGAGLVAALAACQATRPFVSDEGRFSVAMPAEPKHDERSVGEEDPTETHFFTATDGGIAFIVVYADIPVEGRAADDIFDGARDNAAGQPGRTLVSETPVSLGPHPGRELEIAGTDGRHSCVRMFLAGSRFYQVLVVGRDASTVKERSGPFFESFAIL